MIVGLTNIINEIKDAKIIGIAGHIKPDGDCVGSCMALYFYLQQRLSLDTKIDVYLEGIPERLQILDQMEIMSQSQESMTYDLFISLDSGSKDRLGFIESSFDAAKRTINIDHHISNTHFAEINHVIDDASSTCEVLYDLFEEQYIDPKVASCLYLGMIHDTGVFKHTNTSKKTLHIAGNLIEKGIPFSRMIDETFYRKNFRQNKILGRALLESKLYLEGQVIVTMITKDILDEYQCVSGDLEGVVDQLRVTEGVEVAILIHEVEDSIFKISMRANGKVDVSIIAVSFGGGGHVKASGCTVYGAIPEILGKITGAIKQQLIGIH